MMIVTTSQTKGAHMFRYFTVVLALLACVALSGCQKHTSGLIEGAARGDEAVVFSNLRSIMLAQNAHNLSTGSYGTFQQLTDGGYLDARFKGDNPVVKEYKYTMTVTEKTPDTVVASYTCNADPERTGDLTSIMAESGFYGMQTFDQHLVALYREGVIELEDAMSVATNPHDLQVALRAQGLVA